MSLLEESHPYLWSACVSNSQSLLFLQSPIPVLDPLFCLTSSSAFSNAV